MRTSRLNCRRRAGCELHGPAGEPGRKSIEGPARTVLKRVDSRLRALAGNPRPRGVRKLQGPEGEGWRIRVGDYRILYTVDDASQEVTVFRIDLRGNVYRRRR